MSEYSAPSTSGPDPNRDMSSANTIEDADIDQSIDDLEDVFNNENPAEDARRERPGDLQESNLLDLSAEEQETKLRLEGLKETRISIHEAAIPSINNLDGHLDKARDVRNKVAKKAFMLERRESAKQRKSARLEAKLEKATPGTAKYRRLSRKYGMVNIGLKDIQKSISRLDSAPDTRAKERAKVIGLREKEIQLRHDMLKIEKKVAVEKKARRKLKEELKETSNTEQKEWLKEEIQSWPSIGKFREGLIKEAMRKYKAKNEAVS